jgi:hypothetical protein
MGAVCRGVTTGTHLTLPSMSMRCAVTSCEAGAAGALLWIVAVGMFGSKRSASKPHPAERNDRTNDVEA